MAREFDEEAARKREEARLRAKAALEERAKQQGKTRGTDPFLRPPNEDDDGYDPYSDRIERTTMWEEDPWR